MENTLPVSSLGALIPPLLALAHKAGAAIVAHYSAPDAGSFESKDDDSPLTRADLASHAILVEGLAQLDKTIPVLSEESGSIDAAQRMSWHRYWLVDPLDGTKEFLARTGEFTVNIALVEAHSPVLGMLYQPLSDVAHVGIPGAFSRRYQWRDDTWVTEDVATHSLAAGDTLRVLVSRRHRGERLEQSMDWLRDNWGRVNRLNSGSALKFSSLAQGDGDFYPRFSPCCEWDTAAGQAVVEAAGGAVLGMDGEPLRYNCSGSLYSPHFYAIGDPGHALWRALLEPG